MRPPPPRPTLFPYTTLFRSNMGRDEDPKPGEMANRAWPAPFDTDAEARAGLAYQLVEGAALLSNVDWQAKGRSEEHTSELQSRRDLVCRLLLEKKKRRLFRR